MEMAQGQEEVHLRQEYGADHFFFDTSPLTRQKARKHKFSPTDFRTE